MRDQEVTVKVPHYLLGKTEFRKKGFKSYATYGRILKEKAAAVMVGNESSSSWVLAHPLSSSTRNHDIILLEQGNGEYHLVNILGRFSRVVQWMDLNSGFQKQLRTHGLDPAGNRLDDLNHVYSVVVDRMDGTSREVWLPCGFHGDEVNAEYSMSYVRIVDLKDMVVKVGPKLPRFSSGGACVAQAIEVDGPGTPPHICTFGGTDGSHDRGTFLPQTACYDRVRKRWHSIFGRLPFGLDHGNLVAIPAGTCGQSDPARLLIFNFRTEAYGEQRPEVLAFDLPERGWTQEQIDYTTDGSTAVNSSWYVFANFTYAPYSPFEKTNPVDEVNRARDASGVLVADNGRHILNFGGIHYRYPSEKEHAAARRRIPSKKLPKKAILVFQMIRMLDVCEKRWTKVGDLGIETFATMTAASKELNLAFTCGGSATHQHHNNNPWCIASRIPGLQLENTKGNLTSMAPNFVSRSLITSS